MVRLYRIEDTLGLDHFVKLRQGSGKDRQGMALKAKGLTHLSPGNSLISDMTVVCYNVNYLPAGVRIWFWPNCRTRVFGDMANFSSEIG